MISSIFTALFFQPLYNGLVFLMHTIPWIDAGVAVVIFTIIIKLFLFPLSQKSVRTQLKMKTVEPELKTIREKYKSDQKKQSEELLALYRREKINPFLSVILILIQLPIIFALYLVFVRGFPVIRMEMLYSFVQAPLEVNVFFLGLVDITSKSAILATLAGITNFLQIRYAMPAMQHDPKDQSFKANLARSMNIQMKYVFPVMVFFIAYSISAAVAIYWTTSNIFAIGQELYFRKRLKK